MTCVKLTTAQENFKGVVSDYLSFASVEIDKNCWLTLPRWKRLCHRLTRDQPQPGSSSNDQREAEKRDPGNEVESCTGTRVMTSPEVIFTICRRTRALPYHILKSLIITSRTRAIMSCMTAVQSFTFKKHKHVHDF